MVAKKHIDPWDSSKTWKSEAEFWTWLRGGLRKLWMRYPPSIDWKNAQCFKPPPEYRGKAKSVGVCQLCGELVGKSQAEVDHIEEAGSLRSWDDVGVFVKNLLDVNDNWQLVHKECHKKKSYSVRMGISYEQAIIEKDFIIPFKKLKAAAQNEMLLQYGIDGSKINGANRVEEYRKIIEKEKNVGTN